MRDKHGNTQESYGFLKSWFEPDAGNRHEMEQEVLRLLSGAVKGGVSGAYLKCGLPLYFISDQLLELLDYDYDAFIHDTNGDFLNAVHRADRAEYVKRLKSLDSEAAPILEARYRMRKGSGDYLWVSERGSRFNMEGEQPVLVSLRLDISQEMLFHEALERRSRDLSAQNEKLSAIASGLPAAVCKAAMDDTYTLLYANDRFYAFYGYTPQQLREEMDNSLLGAVYEEDILPFREQLAQALASGRGGFELEHRYVRRDGAMGWGLMSGIIRREMGRNILSCMVLDITGRKKMEQELRINEERFRIALAQTDNTIFDYNIITRVMIHADKSAEVYGLPQQMGNVPDSLVELGVVHPDSAETFLEMFGRIRHGAPTASCTTRVRLAHGGFVWRKILMTTIFDQEGCAVRAVGILEDIDRQRRREEHLRRKSERDPLTQLYNRGATENYIRRYLLKKAHNAGGALLVVDVDAFKSVNDRYGHLFGDKVLAESARRISGLFHATDIIGRIGGDEFIVFIKDLQTPEIVGRRAHEICKAFCDAFESGGVAISVSCSVGAAVFPADGDAFEILYQRADIALYEAKKSGKNCFCLYQACMGGGLEWTPYSSTTIDAQG